MNCRLSQFDTRDFLRLVKRPVFCKIWCGGALWCSSAEINKIWCEKTNTITVSKFSLKFTQLNLLYFMWKFCIHQVLIVAINSSSQCPLLVEGPEVHMSGFFWLQHWAHVPASTGWKVQTDPDLLQVIYNIHVYSVINYKCTGADFLFVLTISHPHEWILTVQDVNYVGALQTEDIKQKVK